MTSEKRSKLENNKQPCWTNRLQSGCIIFENKTGIPITPYKECMIDRNESPNATGVARVLILGLHINKIDDITWLFVLNVGKLKRLTPTLLSTQLPHSADYPTDYSAYEVFNFFQYTLQTTLNGLPPRTTLINNQILSLQWKETQEVYSCTCSTNTTITVWRRPPFSFH